MSSSSTASPSNRSRVKLYTLNEERQWDDRGTGFVTCTSPTASNANYSIVVKSELDDSILLESKIQLQTKYQKQQVGRKRVDSYRHPSSFKETLIVWSEGEKYDLALSFQEKAGCDDIWENICDVRPINGCLRSPTKPFSLDSGERLVSIYGDERHSHVGVVDLRIRR